MIWAYADWNDDHSSCNELVCVHRARSRAAQKLLICSETGFTHLPDCAGVTKRLRVSVSVPCGVSVFVGARDFLKAQA